MPISRSRKSRGKEVRKRIVKLLTASSPILWPRPFIKEEMGLKLGKEIEELLRN